MAEQSQSKKRKVVGSLETVNKLTIEELKKVRGHLLQGKIQGSGKPYVEKGERGYVCNLAFKKYPQVDISFMDKSYGKQLVCMRCGIVLKINMQ